MIFDSKRLLFHYFAIILLISLRPGQTNGDRVRFDRLEYRYDRKLANITGGVNSDGIINLDYELFKRVDSFYVNILSSTTKGPKTVYLNKTVDLCKTFKMSAASPLILGMIQLVKKNSNTPFICPEPPGKYYTHNVDPRDVNLPPGRFLNLPKNLKFEITFLRDRINDEQPNSLNGKMLIAKFSALVSFIR